MATVAWVVRVVTDPGSRDWFDNPFLECLRYAGLVTVHPPAAGRQTCFDVLPPHGPSDRTWAERNAARMRSHGLHAVACPQTEPPAEVFRAEPPATPGATGETPPGALCLGCGKPSAAAYCSELCRAYEPAANGVLARVRDNPGHTALLIRHPSRRFLRRLEKRGLIVFRDGGWYAAA